MMKKEKVVPYTEKVVPYALEVDHLVKNYGSLKAVAEVSFHIAPGEIFALLGPNGAGKTSIVSILTTLEKKTSGEVRVFGHSVSENKILVRSLLGLVPQEIVNYGYFNLEEILSFYSGFMGIWKNREQEVFLMKRLRLWEHRYKRLRQLSGGMRRRVLIASALLHRPKLVLMDEPTAGLDVKMRIELWDFIKELKAQGTSILLTTHYLEEAEELCDRLGVLDKGHLVYLGPKEAIIEKLTNRIIHLVLLKEPSSPVKHPHLSKQVREHLYFSCPYSTPLRDLLKNLPFSLEDIKDLQIREGTLEEAILKLVHEQKDQEGQSQGQGQAFNGGSRLHRYKYKEI